MRSKMTTGDLTMRARIRDAAVALFGEVGFDRATVRAVAQRAGASPGLVLHHFGSKEGLKAVCDDYVVTTVLAERQATSTHAQSTGLDAILADVDSHGPLLDYLARLVAEPGESGARVFDALLAHTRKTLDDDRMQHVSDPDTTALLLTAYGLVPLILRSHFARVLGADPLSGDGARVLALPGLELFTHGIYRDDSLLAMAREALGKGNAP